jgi:hypothetical protein
VAQQNTFISSPDLKKEDKIETKSLNIIDARSNVSMQQEPGFAVRPYLKTRSFRLAGPCSMLVATFLGVCYRWLKYRNKLLRDGALSSKLRVKKSLK